MTQIRARTIAIIGAGPSGLAAAKYLRAEKAFSKITIFEQRPQAGGIWNYTPTLVDEDLFTIPQTNPKGQNQEPQYPEPRHIPNGANGTNGVNGKTAPTFLSPVYEKLETNIPRGLMGFQDLDWPSDSQLFPKHETVLQYIKDYGADVQDLVQYSTQVTSVTPTNSSTTGPWTVTTLNLLSQDSKNEEYDAIIVANGHFITPYIPSIPGIEAWNTACPGSITHSKYYRRPEEWSGEKVIVVGNSASGVDISSQLLPYCQHPLLWSVQSSSIFSPPPGTLSEKKELPPISRFLPSTRSVEFSDGTVEEGIDAVVFCTGYFYSLPFLHGLEKGKEVVGDGSHVQHTYQHIFYAPRPTLSFLALPQRVIPFPIAEAQAAVVARVYAGRLALPSKDDMEDWERKMEEETGGGKAFHVMPFPKDGNYINTLHAWASEAAPGPGKTGPKWGDWEFWCRERFPAIRRAFGEKGEVRHQIRRLEVLGFDYEDDKRQREKEEAKLI